MACEIVSGKLRRMKRRFVLCCTLLLLCSGLAHAELPVVLKTRRVVSAIDVRYKKLDKTSRDIMDLSTEGGKGTLWSEKTGKPVRADATIYGETLRTEALIYWQDGKPAFAFLKEIRYPVPITQVRPKGATDRTEETRLYFDAQGTLKLCRVGKKDIPLTDSRSKDARELVTTLITALAPGND
jgi:hypothetical protein